MNALPYLPFLQLMRIPAVFTAVSNILAAHLIVTQGDIHWGTLLLLAAASACLYSGGMVLNDYFDADEDARDRPSRPIPSGAVPRRTALRFAALLLAVGLLLAGLASGTSLLIAALLVALIVLYDGLAKQTPLAAPVMAACRAANWALGLSAVALDAHSLWLALPVFLYVTSLTLLSRVETSADDRRPLYACATGMLATAIAIAWLVEAGTLSHAWTLLPLGFLLAVVLRQLQATLHDFRPEQVQKAVMMLVLGIIPLDAMLAFAGGPWWGGVLVLALWFPGRALAKMMSVT